jgi:hypothetical protein
MNGVIEERQMSVRDSTASAAVTAANRPRNPEFSAPSTTTAERPAAPATMMRMDVHVVHLKTG